MGNNLFGIDISGLIAAHIGPGVLDAILTKFTPGARTVGQPTKGTNPTSVAYPCKGFIAKQNVQNLTGTLVENEGVTIILIGDTINGGLSAPAVDDEIVIEATNFAVLGIDRDPAAATYTCICRRT